MSKPTPPLTHTLRPNLMLDMSLRLIDMRVDHRLQVYHNRNVSRTLTKAVRKSLVVDTCHRSEVVSEKIRECLETPKGTPSDLQGT